MIKIERVINPYFKKNYTKKESIKAPKEKEPITSITKENTVKISVDEGLSRFVPQIFLNKYMNEETIQNALEKNPNIKETLKENGLPVKIYMTNIQGENYKHFISTSKTAQKLSEKMNLKCPYELLEAALLHDIGKVFIPIEILNKKAKLTDEERKIISLHSVLGFEILKTTMISYSVSRMVKLHHQRYDIAQKGNLPAQILSVSDVYSALKEKRPYKKPFNEEEIKTCLNNNKKLNPEIIKNLPQIR